MTPPSKKFSPVSRRFLLSEGIPGALELVTLSSESLSLWASQSLSLWVSQSLSSSPRESTAEVSIGPQSAYAKSQMEFVYTFAGSVRFIYPHQLFCFCVLMHQNLHQRQDIVPDLSKEPSMRSWRQVFSSEWWKDWFRTGINLFHFLRKFLKMGRGVLRIMGIQ